MDNKPKSGCANHPGGPQSPSAAPASAGGAGAGAITAAAERSAASAAAVLSPYGFPLAAALPPPASTAYAMETNPLSPYGYLPPPPPPQLHPSYYSGALPMPTCAMMPVPPPPPWVAAAVSAAGRTVAATASMATRAIATQSSTTTGPTVSSDSSEDSGSNTCIKEGAHKKDMASSSSSSSDSTSDDSGPGSKANVANMESKLEKKVKADESDKASSAESSVGSSGTARSDGTARTDPSDTGTMKSSSESADVDVDDSDEKSAAYSSVDGSPMDDIQSLSSDDNVGQRTLEEEEPDQPNVDGDPLLDVPSAIGSAVSSRAISPILGPNDFSADNSTTSANNGSPRTAARASDRAFSDRSDGSEESQPDGDGFPAEESKTAAMAVTKKEEELPPLGQERHIDEPDGFVWLRPMKCVQARGGCHDDLEKSMTNAMVVSFPVPAAELLALEVRERGVLEFKEDAKWYVRIRWVMVGYRVWMPCEWCREEFGRGERKRTTTSRYTTGPSAATKRNNLLKESAPQKCSVLGSKSCPIDVDDDSDDDNGNDHDGDNAATKIPGSKRKHASLTRASQREVNTQASQKSKRPRRPIVNSTDVFAEWEKDLVLFARGERDGPSPAASAEAAAPSLADNRLDICCECKQLEDPNSRIKMLLCDGCNAACHLPCTHDNLYKVPRNAWYCRSCWSLRESRRSQGRDDDDEPVTFGELQAKLKQLEEENEGLKHEVTSLKEAEQVSLSELLELRRTVKSKSSNRSSSKKRRSSGGRSSAPTAATRSAFGGEAEAEEKKGRPKRESGDIALRRNLLLTFLVVDNEKQSDTTGCGVIAGRNIKEGETFEDRNVRYEEGPPPPSMDQWRYIALESNARKITGYFRLANSHMEMINQPLRGQEANVKWYCSMYQEEGCPARKVLRIKALRDIHEGEEILVVYKHF